MDIISEETENICTNFNKLYSCLHCFDPEYIDRKIKKYHKEGFFMMNLFCLFMKYLEANPKYIMDKLEDKYDKELIFTKKSSGIKIYSMKYKNINNIFLIKFWEKENTFINESLISITTINKVRKKLLNFSIIYGITKNYEYENKKYFVSFYEYIDGISLNEFMKNASEKDLDCIILQVIYALAYVHKNYCFVHNDLHTKNIIIKELDKEYNIPYYDKDDKLFYIKSKYLPVIIDFEGSCVKYKDKIISLQHDMKGTIIINGSFDMYDVLYFLRCITYVLDENNKNMNRKYRNILKKYTNDNLFRSFDIRERLVAASKIKNKQWMKNSTYDFIDFLKNELDFEETTYYVKDNIKNEENKGIENYLEIPKDDKFIDSLSEFAEKINDEDIKNYVKSIKN